MWADIQVLTFAFANLDLKFANKVNHLTMIDIKSLIKLKVDSVENVAHNLILSRCLNQPKVGTPACFISNVVKNEVASHGVWKALVHTHGRKLYSNATTMAELFCRVPGMAQMAGWLWESICHTKICEGGSYIF